MEQKDVIQHNRTFMKSVFGKPGIESDQHKGIPQPTPFKMCGGRRVALSRDFKAAMKNSDYLSLLNTRVSRRAYADTPLSLNVLSFLLWSAQGVKTVKSNLTFRNVPSGGARHPFEVYLAVRNVEGLEKGLTTIWPKHTNSSFFTMSRMWKNRCFPCSTTRALHKQRLSHASLLPALTARNGAIRRPPRSSGLSMQATRLKTST
jgi:hypothetical protein